MSVTHYSLPRNRVLLWLIGQKSDIPDEVQNRLIAPLFTSIAPAAFGAVSVFIFNLAGYVRHPGPAFLILLSIDICLFALRFPLLMRSNRLATEARSTPTGLVISLGLLWCTHVGICNAVCFYTDDYALRELSVATMLGVLTGIVLRNHGCPRLAVVQLVLCDLPFNLVLPFGQDRVLLTLVISSPIYVLGMSSAILKLNKSYVAALLSEYTNKRRASFDALTDLRNRRGLFSALTDQLEKIAELGSLAVFYLDLDGFKAVNDTYGHAAGDGLLQQVAERLVRIAPTYSVVARLGGDEFVLLIAGYTNADATMLGEAIVASVKRPYQLGDVDGVTVGVSIGVALTTTPMSPDALMASADRALYRAKALGKGRVVLSDDSIQPEQIVGRRDNQDESGETFRMRIPPGPG